MIFLFIFFIQFLFAQNSQVLIIHMPGENNEGLHFLNSSLPTTTSLNQEYNQNKTFYHYTHENLRYTIYTNNCPFDQIALGGKKSITFFINMIEYGHKQYPHLPIILAGASASTAAVFGALTKLAKKNLLFAH